MRVFKPFKLLYEDAMTPRIEILSREPFADGVPFATAGTYERLDGRVHFAVDPTAPAYQGIVDLTHAAANREGKVEFSSDFCLLKPLVPSKGNQRLFFGYGNRGNKRELQFFNDAPASNDPRSEADAGNGFLMRRGYIVLWAAWEGDLLPGDGRMILDVPVARRGDQSITGQVRSEFVVNQPGRRCLPLSGYASTRSYPTVSLSTHGAQLTRRRYPDEERQVIPPQRWQFARLEFGGGLDAQGAESALVTSDSHIYLMDGFEPGWIYELVYEAKDPRVHGLGHAVVRDLVSFLKHHPGDENPLSGHIEKAYTWGRSQTGRCIRDFLHLGFNADAQGRRVFDGVMPHVSGGGLMWMNHRFAQVVSPAGQQYEDHHTCADRFPFAYGESTDHLTGKTDAILKRPETDPLVLHTQSATEYWQRRGSLVHTTTRGEDLATPENVRIYLWSSSQHFADPNAGAPQRGVCQQLSNVVQTSMLFRAMLDALDAWCTQGIAPPESRIPRRRDGTLVTMEEWRAQFPAIPAVALPREPNPCPLLNFGPDFEAGLLEEPPRVMGHYAVLVPAVDEDGNDRAGVRAPMVQAALGTYTGWNLRRRGAGHGAMFEFTGSHLPFPRTPAERSFTGDPRPSVAERYPDPKAYQDAIGAAAEILVAAGLMLAEDVERVVAQAAHWGQPAHDITD